MTIAAASSKRKARNIGPFSAVLVLWLVLIGVVAFIAALVIGAFGAEWKSGDNGGGHALSRSAIGFAGAVDVLRGMGTEVQIDRSGYPEAYDPSVLVLTPQAGIRPKALEEMGYEGRSLLVLPKWAPGPYRQGWVRGRITLPAGETLSVVNGREDDEEPAEDDDEEKVEKTELVVDTAKSRRSLLFADGRPFATTGPLDAFRTIRGGGWRAVITDARGGIVLGVKGERWILSDPDLLNTHGISDLATAKAGLGLLALARDGDGPVVFDVSLNGLKAERNLLQLAFTPPFLGVTLALGLAVLLLAMQALARFGPPIERDRAFALGKQGLADNSAALIRLAKREHRMVERYALYVRGEAARAVAIPHAMSETELEALLDRMAAQLSLPAFTQLRREAAAAHDLASAVAAARRLYFWRLEMTRERR